MSKRGKEKDLSRSIYLKAILAVINKPKTISEIANDIAKRLDRNKIKISGYIRKLEKADIIKNLTPESKRSKPGRIYGLTERGIKYKRRLCKKEKVQFSYEIQHLNWYDYGWCIIGSQKKAIILALDTKPLRQIELLRKIREYYVNRNKTKGITRQNLNDILRQMINRDMVEKQTLPRRRKKPMSKYRLTNKGLRIKEFIPS